MLLNVLRVARLLSSEPKRLCVGRGFCVWERGGPFCQIGDFPNRQNGPLAMGDRRSTKHANFLVRALQFKWPGGGVGWPFRPQPNAP